jgi:hypothetical protein
LIGLYSVYYAIRPFDDLANILLQENQNQDSQIHIFFGNHWELVAEEAVKPDQNPRIPKSRLVQGVGFIYESQTRKGKASKIRNPKTDLGVIN